MFRKEFLLCYTRPARKILQPRILLSWQKSVITFGFGELAGRDITPWATDGIMFVFGEFAGRIIFGSRMTSSLLSEGFGDWVNPGFVEASWRLVKWRVILEKFKVHAVCSASRACRERFCCIFAKHVTALLLELDFFL